MNSAGRIALESRPVDPASLQALEQAEAALTAFDAAHPELAALERDRAALERRQVEQASQRAVLEERIEAVRARLAAVAAGDLDSIGDRPGIVRTRQQLDRARLQQGTLAARYGPRHQKMIAADGEVEAARRLLAEEVAVARRQLESTLDDLLAQRADLSAADAELSKRRAALRDRSREREALLAAVEQARRRHSGVAAIPAGALAEAPVPAMPDAPRHLGWLAALFAAIGVAVFALQRSRR